MSGFGKEPEKYTSPEIQNELPPGDRVLVKDLRKEQTWWPGSVAELSRPKSYSRVWKRHWTEYCGQRSIGGELGRRAQDEASGPVPQAILRPGAQFNH